MKRMVFLLMIAVALPACNTQIAQQDEGVAIYLPAQQMSGGEILAADLMSLELQPGPLIPDYDIVSYSPSTHDLILSPGAVQRLPGLRIPVNGIGFVICVGKKPIAAGAFWSPISSLSFEGLTIQVPMDTNDPRLHLYSGYPAQDAGIPNDPRDNPRLLDAFRQEGKLQ